MSKPNVNEPSMKGSHTRSNKCQNVFILSVMEPFPSQSKCMIFFISRLCVLGITHKPIFNALYARGGMVNGLTNQTRLSDTGKLARNHTARKAAVIMWQGNTISVMLVKRAAKNALDTLWRFKCQRFGSCMRWPSGPSSLLCLRALDCAVNFLKIFFGILRLQTLLDAFFLSRIPVAYHMPAPENLDNEITAEAEKRSHDKCSQQ